MAERYLIVGLGNPERKYTATRHNIGFRCVEAIAAAYDITFDKSQAKARIALGQIDDFPVILAKPQTYMNLSGEAVSGLARFYKVPPANLMVIFDDMDIPLGTLRIRKSGGASGQKGVKNIIAQLGTQEFPRTRFGIGRPPGRMDPAAYVLLPFKSDEEILVIETVQRVINAMATWLSDGIDNAMNQHNGSAEEVEQRQLRANTPAPTPGDPTSEA
jgi:PTH1 family peptidyl-tRNA hydrolase